MIFTEFRFVAFFLLVFCVHWGLRSNRARKVWLLVCSYAFYACWDWRFLSLLVFSTGLDYLVGLKLAATDDPKARLRWLRVSLAGNLGMLGVFKYFNFFAREGVELANWLGFQVSPLMFEIGLPVGISFYTFQTLSYSIDIYRNKFAPTRDILDLGLFVAFFPQLVAGPIVRARDFLPQLLKRRELGWVDIRGCLILFLIGFFKKAVVSDGIAHFVDQYFSRYADYDVGSAWLGVGLWAAQVYCDFSGYSDMAIATAGLLGYNLALNFNFPYFSPSISAFWTRWHVSLGYWIRDYVFYSMGAWSDSKLRGWFNLLITWSLAGFWHGADWKYLAFGFLIGPALIVQMQWRLTGLRRKFPMPPLVGNLLTMWWISISLVMYRAEDLGSSWEILSSLLTFRSIGDGVLGDRLAWLLAVLTLVHWINYKGWLTGWWRRPGPLTFTTGFAVAFGIVLTLMTATAEPFIYFQF